MRRGASAWHQPPAGRQRGKCFIGGWGEGRATLGMGMLEGRLYILLEKSGRRKAGVPATQAGAGETCNMHTLRG